MAGKISDLTAAVSAAGADQVELLQSGSNLRCSLTLLVGAANAANVNGIVATSKGGTGIDSSGVTDGQVLIGSTSGHAWHLATLTAGANVTITNAGGSITIAASGGGGGGSPGGSSGNVQYNSGGSFGGATLVNYATSGSILIVQAGALTDTALVVQGSAGSTSSTNPYSTILTGTGVQLAGFVQKGSSVSGGCWWRLSSGGGIPINFGSQTFQGIGFIGQNSYTDNTNWKYDQTGCATIVVLGSFGSGTDRGFGINLLGSGTGGTNISGVNAAALGLLGMPGTPNQWMVNPGTSSPTFGTVAAWMVNPAITADNLAEVQITSAGDSHKCLVIQAHSGTQSGPMTEWQDSAGHVLIRVTQPISTGCVLEVINPNDGQALALSTINSVGGLITSGFLVGTGCGFVMASSGGIIYPSQGSVQADNAAQLGAASYRFSNLYTVAANILINSASAVGLVIQGASGQSVDMLQIKSNAAAFGGAWTVGGVIAVPTGSGSGYWFGPSSAGITNGLYYSASSPTGIVAYASNFVPNADNAKALGDPSFRWADAYIVNLHDSKWVRVTSQVTNATNTMAAISDLSVNLITGRKYIGRISLVAQNTTAAEGLKFDFNGGGATFSAFQAAFSGVPAASGVVLGTVTSTSISTALTATTASTGDTVYSIDFSGVCSGTGTFIPEFAENSAHVSGTAKVEIGSFMMVEDSAN
jgi:hypothetical protein